MSSKKLIRDWYQFWKWTETPKVDNELSKDDSWREMHETVPSAFDREFKIAIVAELESGKPFAQISSEHNIHPNLPARWRIELAENPEKVYGGNGNKYKDKARIAELERLTGQAHAEIDLLKKSLHHDKEEIPGRCL